MSVYYEDGSVTLHHGDSLAVARSLPSGSANCIITSPPYYGLRDYGSEGQYGLEASPAEYVETMRALFSELRRVLADDGTLWLNIGDSYSSSTKGSGGTGRSTLGRRANGVQAMSEAGVLRSQERQQMVPRRLQPGLPEKNLLGIPWRVAFALQDDGWILRNSIIWAKSNPMPESATDRLSGTHENLFMFSKKARYWFDLTPIRETHMAAVAGLKGPGGGGVDGHSKGLGATGERHMYGNEQGKNPGDVWTIATTPFPGAHFATMPAEIPRRCILAGCKPGGTVLDPFSGSGTTGLVAGQLGRQYVGIDISADYLDMSLRTRLAQTALLDDGAA